MTTTAKETFKSEFNNSNFIKIQEESWKYTQPNTPYEFAIDIETLSAQSNAAVIEIALVPFSVMRRTVFWGDRQVWRFSPKIYEPKDMRDFDIADLTITWWQAEPRIHHFNLISETGAQNKSEALELFRSFQDALTAYNLDLEGPRIWAKGASFDFPILNHFQRMLPWSDGSGMNRIHYRNCRCARTLWEESLYGASDWKQLAAEETLHSIPGDPHQADWDAAEVAIKVILAKWGRDSLSATETLMKAIP